MAGDRGRKGGRSFTGAQGGGTKTARPTSVGPHDVREHQEDPANPGIRPEEGYGAEIARNNEAASRQPADPARQPVRPPQPKGGAEMTAEEAEAKSGPPRDAPPLRGTAKE